MLDARKDETATKKKVAEIQGLLVKLEEDLNYTMEESMRLGVYILKNNTTMMLLFGNTKRY